MTEHDHPGPVDGTPTLEARALRVAFGERAILTGLDVAVYPGELVAIQGPSGSGKSR